MKLRFTLIVTLAGILLAGYYRDPYLILLTSFGFCILHSMRCIEYQIGDLKGRIPGQQPKENSLSDAFALIAHEYARKPTLEMRDKIRREFFLSESSSDLADGIAFREKLDAADSMSAIFRGEE